MGLAGHRFDILFFIIRHPTAWLNEQLLMQLLCWLCCLRAVAQHHQLPARLRHHSICTMHLLRQPSDALTEVQRKRSSECLTWMSRAVCAGGSPCPACAASV